MTAIRILLIDNHKIVRDRLLARLQREPDLDVIASIDQADTAALERLPFPPDVILLDPLNHNNGASDMVAELTVRFPDARLIVFTTVVDTFSEIVYRKQGVALWLTKGIDSDALISEITNLV